MLSGLWFRICEILIIGPSLLIVGAMTNMGWSRHLAMKPRNKAASLIALTIALVPDFVLFISLLTRDRLIHVVPGSDNVPLFSEWQIISGLLIVLALSLSLFERKEVKAITLRGSLTLLLIHGAGTLLFFSDSVTAWLKTI